MLKTFGFLARIYKYVARELLHDIVSGLPRFYCLSKSMQMQFVKNIQFTRLIKADGRLREFNFRKMILLNETLFSIDVVDDRGNRIMFRMRKHDNEWQIIPQPLPAWVHQQEKVLSDMISEELNAQTFTIY
jgi:hypothetical protein